MKLSLITRRNKKLFDSKINKKSQFLRSLPKKKFEGQKKVDEGKTELIIDKILGIGEFERDYSFFVNNKTNDKPDKSASKKIIKPSLMNRISDLVKKENINKYEKLDENKESNYYKNNEGEKKYNIASKYWRNKKNNKDNLNIENENHFSSFLSKMGNNVILNDIFSKDRGKNYLNYSENNIPKNSYKKYNYTNIK